MSIGHQFFKEEILNKNFKYGDWEDTIDFVIDNYYEAMLIYRTIIKGNKEVEQLRNDAHAELTDLRVRESRWEKHPDEKPDEFDAKEWERRKDRLANIREEEYELEMNGRPLKRDKLVCFVESHMRVFKFFNAVDMGGRKHLAPFAGKIIGKLLWPLTKTVEMTSKHTDGAEMARFMKEQLKSLREIPKSVEESIMNP